METVKEIIKAYCIVHYPSADGLWNADCGCGFDDLQPCDSSCMDCEPAKWNSEEEMFEPVAK